MAPSQDALPAPPQGVLKGESLRVLSRIPDGSVDLMYLDPPFGTGQTRRLESIRTGRGDRTRRGFGGRDYRYEVASVRSYRDDMPLDDYLGFLDARLRDSHRVLAAHGSLYLHLDYRAAHHARLLLDDIFGSRRFVNEIIWAYDYGGRAKDRWARKHDTILWYARGDRWTFNREAIERIPYMAPGLVGAEKAARGKLPTDVWWMTIAQAGGRERTGYPTQKPERLLERIIAASSNPGELVVDVFCGSGTTGAVAKRLGRRWLISDVSPDAVRISRQRLRSIAGKDSAPDPSNPSA